MATQEQMDQYADDALAYFVGGSGGISENYHAKVVAWLKERHPTITDQEARRCVSLAAKMLGMHEGEGYKLPYLINFNYEFAAGDIVTGGRTYYDEYGKAEGVVVRTSMGDVYFADDNYCEMDSIYKVVWKDDWKNEPATQAQLDLLAAIKADQDDKDMLWVHPTLTKGEARILIDQWPKPGKVQCWECGCWFDPKDAVPDFFDRWYCGC